MREIICLKSKAYFMKVEEKEFKKLKGISKATVKHQNKIIKMHMIVLYDEEKQIS